MWCLSQTLLLTLSLFTFRGDLLADVVPISETEAAQRVAAEISAKASREAALKAKLQSVPAGAEWESNDGERKVVFRYLSGVGSFETEDRVYSYFNFTDIVDQEKEAETVLRAAELGYDYKPRWQAAPVVFSGVDPEYVTVTADDGPLPEEVYRRLDDLFAHYLERKTELKIQYYNRNILNAAREEHLESRPPKPPQDIIINFYPLSERKTAR